VKPVLVLLFGGLLMSACSGACGTSSAGSLPGVAAPAPRPEPKAPRRRTFSTYEEALAFVRSNHRGESIDTSRSSWVRCAEYYEARGQGFFILCTDQKDYLYADMPKHLWQAFKSASSLGTFYNQNIKGRFYFDLNAGIE